MILVKLINDLWRRIRRKHKLGKIIYVSSMQEIPNNLGSSVYIVGYPKSKWVILSCPCGCGERLDVNLMRSLYPYWIIQIAKKTITIQPSLYVDKNKCSSHFWIKNSHIIWVGEEIH